MKKVSARTLIAAVLATAAVTIVVVNWSPGEERLEQPIHARIRRWRIRDSSARWRGLLGPPLLPGNAVVELLNGDQIFPSMLEAIRAAERTISFETYIYWRGMIGRRFTDALVERARAGVRVHVLVDWMGAKVDEQMLAEMRGAGVEFEFFRPLRWYNLDRINNRTHRKLLVVDGKVGFTGGVGVADHWLGNAQDAEHWRDSHFRMEGPAVAQMQGAFMDNWTRTRGVRAARRRLLPPARARGPGARADGHQRAGRRQRGHAHPVHVLDRRRGESIYLANSYFLPDDLAVQALLAARKRGVDVQVIVPGPIIDTQITRRASRARWGPLLEGGIEIYEYLPTMYHCKVLVVDDASSRSAPRTSTSARSCSTARRT